MAFSDVVFMEEAVFWYDSEHFPDAITWSGDYTEISHLELGMLSGGYIDVDMETAFTEQGPITRADTAKALFQMLIHDRVELIATDHQVGRHYAAQMGMADRFRRIVRPITLKASHFGLSRITGAADHVEAFNRALQTLRRAGRIDLLQRRQR